MGRTVHHICQCEYEKEKGVVHIVCKKNMCQFCVDDIFSKSVINGKGERIDLSHKGKGYKYIIIAGKQRGERCVLCLLYLLNI